MPKPDRLLTDINSALLLITEMLHVLTQHFETGATFNPTDLRDKHSQIKKHLAGIGEQIASMSAPPPEPPPPIVPTGGK